MTTINVTPSLLTGYNTTVFTNSAVAANAVTWTTGHSPITVFTVTGVVAARIYGVVGATALTSTGGTGTLSLGISGSVTNILGTSTVDGTNFPINGVWVDTSPTVLAKVFVAANLTWINISTANVILTIATNSMTAGAMSIYCNWVPLSAGATVV